MDGERDFAAVYAKAQDEELLELARNMSDLVPVAQQVLREEFRRRSLELPQEEHIYAEYEDVVTLASYRDLSTAVVAKGLLNSAGVECWLKDENIVRLNWAVSNLVGGIRLQVRRSDEGVARELLAGEIPSVIPLEADVDYEQPSCPKCGSLDVSYESNNQKAGMAAAFLLSVPMVLANNRWKCNACGAEWDDVADDV